jgi:hypothetical protein
MSVERLSGLLCGKTGRVRFKDTSVLRMRTRPAAALVAQTPAPCEKRKERGTPNLTLKKIRGVIALSP